VEQIFVSSLLFSKAANIVALGLTGVPLATAINDSYYSNSN